MIAGRKAHAPASAQRLRTSLSCEASSSSSGWQASWHECCGDVKAPKHQRYPIPKVPAMLTAPNTRVIRNEFNPPLTRPLPPSPTAPPPSAPNPSPATGKKDFNEFRLRRRMPWALNFLSSAPSTKTICLDYFLLACCFSVGSLQAPSLSQVDSRSPWSRQGIANTGMEKCDMSFAAWVARICSAAVQQTARLAAGAFVESLPKLKRQENRVPCLATLRQQPRHLSLQEIPAPCV